MDKKSFKPFVDENSKILILGTLPGDTSLENKEYYSSPNNQIWKILSAIFNPKYELKTYQDKKKFLYENHIALWDIYEKAKRKKGSKDKDIINSKTSDIKFFLNKYKNIKTILFNGQRAEKEFIHYIKDNKMETFLSDRNIKYTYVFSSSGSKPVKLEEKIENWKNSMNINIK